MDFSDDMLDRYFPAQKKLKTENESSSGNRANLVPFIQWLMAAATQALNDPQTHNIARIESVVDNIGGQEGRTLLYLINS